MFRKTKLFDMPDIYTVNAFTLGSKFYIGMGPEKSGNPYLITYPSLNKTEAGIAPGGMMSLIPVPGRSDMLVSVMGLFPPFQGKDARSLSAYPFRGYLECRESIAFTFCTSV